MMKQSKLKTTEKFLSFIIIPAIILLMGMLPACSSASTNVFTVQIGLEDISNGLEVDAFFPDFVTVSVGDTITFTQKTHEIHTVTFGAPSPLPRVFLNQRMENIIANPLVFLPSPSAPTRAPGTPLAISTTFDGTNYVNSGALQTPGDTFSVKFTKPGTYQFVCLLHSSSMNGTVVVRPAGSSIYQTQSDIDNEVRQASADYEQSGSDFLNGLVIPSVINNSDGTRTFTVLAGAGDETQGFDFMYFFGGTNLTIKTGDKVTWTVDKNTPGMMHTITFLSGANEPDFIISQSPSSGSSQLIVNPVVSAPSPVPPAPFAGTGYYNSGLLTSGVTPQSFTLMFTEPGKYDYICVPHDTMGMKGTITVTP
jgi:plastocyanin